jgi:formylglycine-generating enzyme required for sulfatase activity
MKYELTQAQYRDFLNTLTYNQQTKMVLLPCNLAAINKYVMHKGPTGSTSGLAYLANGLSTRRICTAATLTPAVIGCNSNGGVGWNATHNASNDGMWTACNLLPWPMSAAYLDWAGLRPMTEMELEKASRGSQYPVANEGAMGIIVYSTSNQDYGANPGSATQGSANASFYHACGTRPISGGTTNWSYGPFRVGSFAKSNSSRQSSGASFWGIMDLTGNVHENAVSVANGRSFTGNHGDGTLSSNGYANATAWPGLSSGEVTGTTGIMPRGGGFFGNHWDSQYSMRNPISSRYWVSYSWPTFPRCGDIWGNLELSNPGNRGVRTAP